MKRVEVIKFELETVRDWIRKMKPGRYELSQLLGDLWTIVRRKRWFGKPFKAAVLAGKIPGVRLIGKKSNRCLEYELSA